MKADAGLPQRRQWTRPTGHRRPAWTEARPVAHRRTLRPRNRSAATIGSRCFPRAGGRGRPCPESSRRQARTRELAVLVPPALAAADRPCRRVSGLRPPRGAIPSSPTGQAYGQSSGRYAIPGQVSRHSAQRARGIASTNIAAMRSKQASVARLSVQTGTGQPICSARMSS